MPTSDAGAVSAALAAVRRRQQPGEPDPGESDPGVAKDAGVLADAVEAVLAIHRPSRLTVGGYVCGKCLDGYPCTTVQALARQLRNVDP